MKSWGSENCVDVKEKTMSGKTGASAAKKKKTLCMKTTAAAAANNNSRSSSTQCLWDKKKRVSE